MTHAIKLVASILCFLLLAACSAGEDRFAAPTAERKARVAEVVAAADWSNAETRAVLLDEYKFAPADLTFRRNRPYELTITNKGGNAHTFVAPAFFDAVAVSALVSADGEARMPLLRSVALAAGETKTLIFVPLGAGEFPLVCDRPLHEIFGMQGKIRVE